jgi:putative oxidoreductase
MNTDNGLLLLRLAAGALMLPHGWGKLMRLLDGNTSFADPIGIGPLPSLLAAIGAEVFCTLAVMVGFKTRWAALPVAFTMAVAALVVHADDPWNRKELPLLYLAVFLAIAVAGAGRHALDARLAGRRRKAA